MTSDDDLDGIGERFNASTPGHVYFVRCCFGAAPPIKIGWSLRSAERRVHLLQIGCPWPLRLVRVYPGCVNDERTLHAFLRSQGKQIRSEWFRGAAVSELLRVADDYSFAHVLNACAALLRVPPTTRLGMVRRLLSDAVNASA